MLKSILLVGSGGFLGSVLRFLVQNYFVQLSTSKIPWGTFTANALGSFLIGVIYAWVEKQGFFSQEIRLLFAVGFCGGFTTFSSFAAENLSLLKSGNIGAFTIYTLISVLVGIILVLVGYQLLKWLS